MITRDRAGLVALICLTLFIIVAGCAALFGRPGVPAVVNEQGVVVKEAIPPTKGIVQQGADAANTIGAGGIGAILGAIGTVGAAITAWWQRKDKRFNATEMVRLLDAIKSEAGHLANDVDVEALIRRVAPPGEGGFGAYLAAVHAALKQRGV